MNGDDNSLDFLEIWSDYSNEEPGVPQREARKPQRPVLRGGMIRPGAQGNLVAAETLIKKERYDEALVRLERVLTEDPDHREALFKAALIRKRLMMLGDALRSLDRLIELEPEFPGLRYERGTCHYQMKNWALAMEDLEVYVHMARERPEEERFVKKALKLHSAARKRYAG